MEKRGVFGDDFFNKVCFRKKSIRHANIIEKDCFFV
jgi:hypothetical protein